MTNSSPSQLLQASPLASVGALSVPTPSTDKILITAVDPGKMCGVGIFQWTATYRKFSSIELTPIVAATYVRRHLEEMSGWVVAVERFTPDHRTASVQLDAIEVIGMLRYVVETSIRMDHRFDLQSRSEAKKIGGTQVLKKLGWHKNTKDGHANDAANHVLLALLRRFPRDYASLMDELQST